MDQLKGALGSFGGGKKNNNEGEIPQTTEGSSTGQQSGGGGFLSGLGDKFNSAAGGGKESEKNEDYLDKGELIVIFPTPKPQSIPYLMQYQPHKADPTCFT